MDTKVYIDSAWALVHPNNLALARVEGLCIFFQKKSISGLCVFQKKCSTIYEGHAQCMTVPTLCITVL